MFSQVGQRFRILREIDPPTREQIIKAAEEQGIKLVDGEKASESENADSEQESVSEMSADARREQAVDRQVPEKDPVPAPAPRPKIIQIGDTQIKYDGDKVYQKQWIRLTQSEQSNFRVVNDSSNKIVPLTGKHIEARRWVIVETADFDGDGDKTESIING